MPPATIMYIFFREGTLWGVAAEGDTMGCGWGESTTDAGVAGFTSGVMTGCAGASGWESGEGIGEEADCEGFGVGVGEASGSELVG